MAGQSISEVYFAVCAQHQIKINPHVLEVLKKTRTTENVTLNLSGNDRLRHIQRLDDDDILALTKCLSNNTSVTGLDVSYNNITDEGAGHLADLLQEGNSALSRLDLMFNDILTDGAEALAKSLQGNSSLLSLRLSGNKIGNSGAMHLASTLQVNNTLQELQLADCDLATQSVMALTIVLKSNKSLRSVDISRPLLFSHQEEWAVHLSEMLAVNSSLVELHLGKMGMTDSGMERLTEGLRLNHSLRYLDLRCNRVTRDGVRHLAEVLKNNPSLEVLDLSSNRIEDEGAVYLSEAVTRPGCILRELSVRSNNIRTEGLLSLANTPLTHIYIWGNHLEEPVCRAFKQLIASGRLLPEQTDVSAYEVDGHVFLAEVFNGLRRRYYSTDTHSDSNTATDTHSDPNTATDTHSDPNTATDTHSDSNNVTDTHSESNTATDTHSDSNTATDTHSESNTATDTSITNAASPDATVPAHILEQPLVPLQSC